MLREKEREKKHIPFNFTILCIALHFTVSFSQNGVCFSKTSVTFKMPLMENKEILESVYDYLLYQFRKTPVCYSEDQYLSPPEHTAEVNN